MFKHFEVLDNETIGYMVHRIFCLSFKILVFKNTVFSKINYFLNKRGIYKTHVPWIEMDCSGLNTQQERLTLTSQTEHDLPVGGHLQGSSSALGRRQS
jgi:hypothetical protein